jgi:hypothetical protein
MPDPAADVIVELVWDASYWWLVVPLAVGQDVILEMLPNPLLSRSVIASRVREI